jgi:hypothetical protein
VERLQEYTSIYGIFRGDAPMEYAVGDDPKVFCTVTIKSLGLLGLQSDFSVSIRRVHTAYLTHASSSFRLFVHLFLFTYEHVHIYASSLHTH